jgi:DNA-binding response OmpR family regulator
MLTAVGFELNVKLGQQMGADGYMTKPFTPQALLDKIAEFLPATEVPAGSEG